MGNSVFCSIAPADGDMSVFDIVKGDNPFDLEKNILPLPALFKEVEYINGYRDVLVTHHIHGLIDQSNLENLKGQLKAESRFANEQISVDECMDLLLAIWDEKFAGSYGKRKGRILKNPVSYFWDNNYIFPPTLAQVDAQAEHLYQLLAETGFIHVASWRYHHFGCSWQPRFSELEDDILKFEAITSAPVKGFKLFAEATGFTGDIEYFEDSEDFWGVMVFDNGVLVEHRENQEDDFLQMYGDERGELVSTDE